MLCHVSTFLMSQSGPDGAHNEIVSAVCSMRETHYANAIAIIACMQIKELDPGNASAGKAVQRLTPIVNERREKMKDEMLGEFDLCRLSSVCAEHCWVSAIPPVP